MAAKKTKKTKKAEPKKAVPIVIDEKRQRYIELEEQCVKIINENHIFFIKDLCAFLPFARSTFYDLGLDKSDRIREEINKQKIATKQALKLRWAVSDNATLQIALYRLLADAEEKEALNSYHKQQNNEEQTEGQLPINQMFANLQKTIKGVAND